MWSQIIKPEEEVVNINIKEEDSFNIIPVVRGEQIRFKREIKYFIEEHQSILDNIYNKYFKGYEHISKKDFYIFAYARSNHE